jgi:hypothetical protein
MPRDPNVIGAARPITRAAIIWPIANRDRDGSWITTTVIGSRRAVIRSVSWISGVSPFTSRCTKGGRNQNQHECGPFQSRFCSTLCGNCCRLPMINNVRFHTLSIRITNSLYAPVSIERAPGRGKKGVDRKALDDALIQHRVCHFHEAGNVRADYKVARVAVLGGSFPGVFMDRGHDVAQT